MLVKPRASCVGMDLHNHDDGASSINLLRVHAFQSSTNPLLYNIFAMVSIERMVMHQPTDSALHSPPGYARISFPLHRRCCLNPPYLCNKNSELRNVNLLLQQFPLSSSLDCHECGLHESNHSSPLALL
jgi:hypothetical protein